MAAADPAGVAAVAEAPRDAVAATAGEAAARHEGAEAGTGGAAVARQDAAEAGVAVVARLAAVEGAAAAAEAVGMCDQG